MASSAEIQQQITATEAAIKTLTTVLAAQTSGSADSKSIQTEITRLTVQLNTLITEQAGSLTATNPPNPQISTATTAPPPPPLIGKATPANNPPDPQVPGVNATGGSAAQISNTTTLAVQDSATATGQGNVLATLDSTQTINESEIDRNADGVVFQTVFFPDGRSLEVAAGSYVNEQGFVVGADQISRTPEDVLAQQEADSVDGAILYTAGGQYIVDDENPDFVIGAGGIRVLADDVAADDAAAAQEQERPITDLNGGSVEEAAAAQALLNQARQQASVAAQRKANGKAVGDGDWRVRLRLAPNASYFYKTDASGIMAPLYSTDGVIFPYTPRIDMTYTADYNPYDLTHSNYRGYFYKGSKVGEIIVNADFTAQDSKEADYLLACIHFFRSCTKMFYGQDNFRGVPPPMVFLSGLGEFQFNEHPCVISQFNYNLPNDVDYIRSRGRQSTSSGATQGGNGLMWRRTLTSSAISSYSISSIIARLTGSNLPQGAVNIPPPPPNLGLNSPTYVPTKMSISLTLLPMNTRRQVSQQFSLEKYANGNALRGGFW